jgi:group I intron endonuclease
MVYTDYKKELGDMIGIYIIKCNANNKVYIGQSINLKHRLNEHKSNLLRGVHNNKHLQKAFNKYGKEEFTFDILEILSKENYNKTKLDLLEIEYIAKFESNNRRKGFNIENGGNSIGKIGEETKKKISIALKGNHNNANAWLGKHHSEETKKLYSLQRKGKPSHLKGTTQTKEHIKKRTDCQNGKVWVNNGNNSKFVTQDEAQQLVSMGYVYGRPFFKRIKGRKYQYKGKPLTIPQISELCGINKFTLQERIRRGWCLEKATTTPIKK